MPQTISRQNSTGAYPSDLIDIAAVNGLHFDGAYQQGVYST